MDHNNMLYLLPPSEGKAYGGDVSNDATKNLLCSGMFPESIASNATEKDLKCTGKRYKEGVLLNKNIQVSGTMKAIDRYTGVMYAAIGYSTLTEQQKSFFDKHVLIISGYYGLLTPTDYIANYKLPIGAKRLKSYWKNILTDILLNYCKKHCIQTIIDLLPNIHQSVFDRSLLQNQGIERSVKLFTTVDEQGNEKRLTHGVKKVKGAWLRSEIQLRSSRKRLSEVYTL